jgi:hypothetical protein
MVTVVGRRFKRIHGDVGFTTKTQRHEDTKEKTMSQALLISSCVFVPLRLCVDDFLRWIAFRNYMATRVQVTWRERCRGI